MISFPDIRSGFFIRIHTTLTVVVAVCGAAVPTWAITPTTTTLALKSGGNAVTTVATGSVVTLTASVTLAGLPVSTGQVSFCDATATDCLGIHLLGTAQLTL